MQGLCEGSVAIVIVLARVQLVLQRLRVDLLCASAHFAQGLRVWIWPMVGTAYYSWI
jgi:hypothetical protein